jgi:hypothetical protein
MESSHLITSPGIAVEPSASGWSVFGDAWRLVRRDWAPPLATLSILWLVWFVPRPLIGALWFGHAWNAGSAGTVITAEAARGTVLARSADGRVTLFGGRGSSGIHLVTRLPGKMAGVMWVMFRTTPGTTWSVRRQNAALRRLWRGLQIEGAPLPVIR